MPILITRLLTVPATVLILTLAACGGGDAATPQPTATGPIAGADCAGDLNGARQVKFGNDGKTDLYGIVLGTGAKGIVLGHQNGGSVCQWIFNAKEWATQGYHVLAFDFGGFGASSAAPSGLVQDMTAAAAFLRTDGATSVVLIGGSMGGSAAIAAAAVITPPVNGAVGLSAPTNFGNANALDAAAKLTMPVLYLAGEFESSYVSGAQQMYDLSTKAAARTVLIAPGTANHGVSLVQPGGNAQAREALTAFLKATLM